MDNTLVKFSPKASKLHHQAHHVRHTTGVASNLPDCTAARRPEHEVVHYVLLAGTARVHQTRTTFTTPVESNTRTRATGSLEGPIRVVSTWADLGIRPKQMPISEGIHFPKKNKEVPEFLDPGCLISTDCCNAYWP